jgi:GT2 family glycosyltransferase
VAGKSFEHQVMIDVSVIIINFNTFRLTSDCIRSVYGQTKGVSFEIILVDNASHECDPSIFKKEFPDIHLICSKQNLGFTGGNNLAIKKARGEYILLLNSDTVLKNNAIRLSLNKFSGRKDIGALTCKLLYEDGTPQPVAGRFPSVMRELRDFLRLTKRLSKAQRAEEYLGTEFDYTTEKEVDWIWGTFFMFPRSILRHFEGQILPSDYFMYVEDVLWAHHIRKAGYKIFYFPDGEVYHFIAGSSQHDEKDSFARYKRKILPNEYDLIRKTRGWLYTKCFYAIKALNHLSLRTAADLVKARTYFSLTFGLIKNNQ